MPIFLLLVVAVRVVQELVVAAVQVNLSREQINQ